MIRIILIGQGPFVVACLMPLCGNGVLLTVKRQENICYNQAVVSAVLNNQDERWWLTCRGSLLL
jgi:hypothetical protein